MSNGEHGDAFELAGDPTRLAILRALVAHRREADPGEWPTFAELRRRVGARDSGNFNYHLDRLVGRFVERTDDGYRLTRQGAAVVAPLLAGAYEEHEAESKALDEGCVFCGREITATVEEGGVEIACPSGHAFGEELPPGAVAERSMDAVLSLAATKMRTDAAFVVRGVCPVCYGELTVDLVRPAGASTGVDHLYYATCGRCGNPYRGPPEMLALVHPPVVAFYHEHGVDAAERPYWTLPFPDHEVAVRSEDPVRIDVVVRLGDDARRVTLDGSASLVEVGRE